MRTICHTVGETRVFDETARLVACRSIARDTAELAFHAPRIAAAARPGQFVNVLLPSAGFGYRVFESEAEWRAAPRLPRPALIRRPFSVYRTYGTYGTCATRPADAGSSGAAAPDTIDLLVKVVGPATRALAELPLGSEVRILGPLGNGFELPPPGAAAGLVAGGCGWASLAMLARELRRRNHPVYAFIGAKTVEDLPVTTDASAKRHPFLDDLPEACVTSRELEGLGAVIALAAEQGGRVYGGLVTDLLEKFLASAHGIGAHLYACGPWAMLCRVAELAEEHGSPCQVALEERMGCGIGVCNSCVVEVLLPDGSVGHKRLCVDGPVLDAREVVWSRGR